MFSTLHDSQFAQRKAGHRSNTLPWRQNPICSSVFIGYESGDFFLLRRFSHSNPFVTSPAPKETRYLVQTVTIRENGAPLGVLYFYDESLKMLERRAVANYQFDPRMRP